MELYIHVYIHVRTYTYLYLFSGFSVGRVLAGGWTSLMYASEYGVSDVVNLLLDFGADAKAQIGWCS